MKHIKILSLLLLTLIGLGACEEEDLLIVDSTGGASLLEADISTIELDRDNTSNPALTLLWDPATYTVQTPANYQIEASADESFATSAKSQTVTTNSITFSVNDLNSLAGSAGLPPFEWNTLYLRVTSFLGASEGTAETISNIINVNVYTYYNYPVRDFYLVGPASASGWNNNNNNAVLFRNVDNTNEFIYTGRFNSGPLKMLESRGAWAPQYGEGGDDFTLAYRATEADSDPSAINDLESLTDGYYTFTANIGTERFTIEPFDISGATPLESLTISGSALGAEAALGQYDIDGVVFDEFIWYIPSVRMIPGEIAFTANGSQSWGSTTLFSGIATPDGGNIPIDVEDDYEVWFNSLTGAYHIIPINLSKS